MTYCKINGIQWDLNVAISGIEETFNILDGPNAGRAKSARMIRDPLGTFIGHKITFSRGENNAQFDALWDFLIEHSTDDSVMLEAADGQTSIRYEAYYTSGKRDLLKSANGVNYWDKIEVNFVPIDAQVKP